MMGDKYSAVWVSHTSISDFLRCPRSYYLKNIYRDPKTNHKIKLISPPMALGQAVHEVLESLSILPVETRFDKSLVVKLADVWPKISGKLGGFSNLEVETQYRKRGEVMLEKVMSNPGPLKNLAVKIKMNLPYFWLSEKDNIILCGKIDWLEFFPESESVKIIDFKTSKSEEDPQSLQLAIYYLLASHCQKYPVAGVSYWYLERNNEPIKQNLPDEAESEEKILAIAKKIKLARQLNHFKCPHQTGCSACKPLEAVLRGEAEFVGVNSYHDDIYILDRSDETTKSESVVL
jgi:CRISPR/Cas system-associated exonuclease Cas4 (RecB family)